MAETLAPRPMEAGGGPQPREAPMPGAGGERPKGPPVKIPKSDDAFISDRTLCELMDPANLNSGILQDIYQTREDDFEEPVELEIWYMVGSQPQREFVFIDPLHSQERPRICVSVKAVQAMHRAIAVLTRKLDNILVTLRHCREHYWKELTLLRELLFRKEQKKDQAFEQEHHTAEHFAAFFNQAQYQDEITVSLFKQRLEEATHDLDQKLQMKQAEIRKLYQRINKMEMGFDALDRVEQRDYEEQLQDLQCDHEALREEKEAKEAECEEKDNLIKEQEKLIAELKEEIDLTRDLVQKREGKHKQLLGLVEEEKVQLEKKLEAERKDWNATRKTLTEQNAQLTEENEMHKAAAQQSKDSKQFESAYSKVKLIRSKKRYSAEDTYNEGDEEERRFFNQERRSTLTHMPSHITSLSSPRPSAGAPGNGNSHILDLLKGSMKPPIEESEEGAESADGSSSTAAVADAEKKRTFLEKVEEKRRKTIEAREQMHKEQAQGAADGEINLPEHDVPMEEQVSGETEENEMDEIERLWAQVYKKPEPKIEQKEEPQLDPDQLISLVVESIESLAKQGPVARKKAAMALVCEMALNELRSLRDSLDARAYAALNALKEPITASVARQKAGKAGPALKSRPGSPLTSRKDGMKVEAKSRAGSPRGRPASPSSHGGSRRDSGAGLQKGADGGKTGAGQLHPNRGGQNFTRDASPRGAPNLRPVSPSGRSGAPSTSRPASRQHSSRDRKQPRRRRQKDGQAEETGNDDSFEGNRRKAFAEGGLSGLDMDMVSERLKGHIEEGDMHRERSAEDDRRSYSGSSSGGNSENGSRRGSGHGSAHGSEHGNARHSEKEDGTLTPEDIPVDQLLSTWTKPFTAETDSTREPHSATFLEDLPNVDETSPLARRVKRQKELNALFKLLSDPRLGKPRKLQRSMSPTSAAINKKQEKMQSVARRTLVGQSPNSEEEDDDEEVDDPTPIDFDDPLLQGKEESKALPRAKSVPVVIPEGQRLMDQLDLLPDVVFEIPSEDEEKRGRHGSASKRRGASRSRSKFRRESGSGDSTPRSRGRSPASPGSPRSTATSRRGSGTRRSLVADFKKSGTKSRRGSFSEPQGNLQRSHSLPPCWSMPMHLEPHTYPELANLTTGLRRLLTELPDLPPRHFNVCSELLLAGWVLSHPSGHAYESMFDAAEFDDPESRRGSTGQADGFLDSAMVAEHASRAGFSYMPELAVPEMMVKSLSTPLQGRSSKGFLSSAGRQSPSPRGTSPGPPRQGTDAGESDGRAADGDAAAGSIRLGFEESPSPRGSDRRGSGNRSRPSTGASGASSAQKEAAAKAMVSMRRGLSLATPHLADSGGSLAKGRFGMSSTPQQDLSGLMITGHHANVAGRKETISAGVGSDYPLDQMDNVDLRDGGASAQDLFIGQSEQEARPRGAPSGKKMLGRVGTVTLGGVEDWPPISASPAPSVTAAFPASKFSVHQLRNPLQNPPQDTGSQNMPADNLPPAAAFQSRRGAAGAFQKAMRSHGFRVVAGTTGNRRRGAAEVFSQVLEGPPAAARGTLGAGKPKPRMVSVGTQTNLSVSNRFEVVPDMDEGEAMKWRETAKQMDKEELRVRIAKELLTLCAEIRQMAGMQDVQEIPTSLLASSGKSHIGEDLLGQSPVKFNNLGLSVSALHRPLLPKGSIKSSIRARRHMQAANRQFNAAALLERGGVQIGLPQGGMQIGLPKQATSRPSLRQLAEARFSIDEESFSLRGKTALLEEKQAKPFEFQVKEANSSDEEHLEKTCVCGHQFAPDETFCHKCGAQRRGAKQLHLCACGNPFMPGAVFCRGCGSMRPMDALGGAGCAHHRHDEDELDPAGSQLSARAQVNFQGKEDELGALNKNSQATMSTVASESMLVTGQQRQLAASASDEQVEGLGLPEINPVEQLYDNLSMKGRSHAAKGPGGGALSAHHLATSPRQATKARIPKRPGTGPPAQTLDRGKIDVNRIVNAIREADEGGGLVKDMRGMADDVVERSRQWLSHEQRQHGGGPLQVRPLDRPQTQEQQRSRRTSELPPVDIDENKWYPQQSRDSVSAHPLRALLKR